MCGGSHPAVKVLHMEVLRCAMQAERIDITWVPANATGPSDGPRRLAMAVHDADGLPDHWLPPGSARSRRSSDCSPLGSERSHLSSEGSHSSSERSHPNSERSPRAPNSSHPSSEALHPSSEGSHPGSGGLHPSSGRSPRGSERSSELPSLPPGSGGPSPRISRAHTTITPTLSAKITVAATGRLPSRDGYPSVACTVSLGYVPTFEGSLNFKDQQSVEKLRGAYYTSPSIASFLLRWVLSDRPSSLLEPSCGDGVFFRQLTSLAQEKHPERVVGFELDAAEAAKAVSAGENLKHGITVHASDFLSWALLQQQLNPCFDAVVGNPPFIRYQYLDPVSQEVAERLFAALRLRFTRHTNAWVPFVVASMALLRPGGRLAMVLPAELLHVLHAEALRTFLGHECSRVLVFDPDQLWFEGILQGAVLLLAEKKRTRSSPSKGVAVQAVVGNSFLEQDPNLAFEAASFANGATASGKWMWALLSAGERNLLSDVVALPEVHRFGEIAEADVGIVTGANRFFLVRDDIVKEYGLQAWAHPMFGRSEHVPGVVYDRGVHDANREQGLPTNFLWLDLPPGKPLPPGLRKYIMSGERQELHKRYKCRIREPWYLVPSVYATPVGMLKRCHDFPRLVLNEAMAYTTDTAYRIKPIRVEPAQLVSSFVNSLTAASAEMEGRHYGGGVLELVPSEIERLLIPVATVDRRDVSDLDRMFRSASPAEEILRLQDTRVLAPLGLSRSSWDTIHDIWWRLRCRRQRVTETVTADSDA
jgi:adenine-specific DNA-methyltransferase